MAQIKELDLIEKTALAQVLHSFYNGIENILLVIVKAIDEKVPSNYLWHRELLDQISQKTETRLAVISSELKESLLEYLGFRHVVRHIYSTNLDAERLLVPHAGGLSVSNGGLILFGLDDVRQRYFPDARVSCARFRGTDKSEFIDRIDIAGSVLNAIDEVPRFIHRNTRLAAKIENMHRQDIPEYPELAIREILVNAIGHADYSLSGMRIQGNEVDGGMGKRV